jgi:hypothetical protein
MFPLMTQCSAHTAAQTSYVRRNMWTLHIATHMDWLQDVFICTILVYTPIALTFSALVELAVGLTVLQLSK